ncbi:hypothetical protein [Leptotrichia sp. oral taxon 225]|jgi:hypothetical protein cdivTM_19712|uniref:hypothetical protein n=1 Tax=Leptotrichia sp. oral taxon 225 TaxID=671213 RepID=UPI0003AE3462|nr:hypothetical protein [Leptotrichia sp. oral taxon 225]ERL27249.1 hypothetical protein HMPREF9108_00175 [Leptotrichia sp. oral taxon 225 str. F0581]
MDKIDILRKVVTTANKERKKKWIETQKERKIQALAFVEFLGELQIPGEQIIQIVDKVTDLLEVSIDNVVFEALIDESEQIMQVFDEEEDRQPLS